MVMNDRNDGGQDGTAAGTGGACIPGADTAGGLLKLYRMFSHSSFVRYHESLELPTCFHLEGEALTSYIAGGTCSPEYPHLCAMEVLEVRRERGPRETLLIANPPGLEQTWITWEGDDRQVMMKTLTDMRLPNSWPQNAGHKVFYMFRERLRSEAVQEGPASLTIALIKGKERHFRVIVSALLDLYSRI